MGNLRAGSELMLHQLTEKPAYRLVRDMPGGEGLPELTFKRKEGGILGNLERNEGGRAYTLRECEAMAHRILENGRLDDAEAEAIAKSYAGLVCSGTQLRAVNEFAEEQGITYVLFRLVEVDGVLQPHIGRLTTSKKNGLKVTRVVTYPWVASEGGDE